MNELSRKYFLSNAIDGWEDISKNELANLCIENENNPELYNKYLSALICKYMYKNYTMMDQFGQFINEEEMADLVVDGILRALKYRSWLREGTNVYGDPNGPDKTINRCIKSTCQVFRRLNFGKGKNKADSKRTRYFTESLDGCTEEYGDYYYNLVKDNKEEVENQNCDSIIIKYLEDGKLLEALILDNICYQDSFEEITKSKKIKNEEDETEKVKVSVLDYSQRKLVKNITTMNESYIRYFADKYGVKESDVYDLKDDINSHSHNGSKYLNRYINNFLSNLRINKKKVEDTLCY